VEAIYSAPVARACSTFCSVMAVEMCLNFTIKVPPKPQQLSVSSISVRSSPSTPRSNSRGSSLIPYSRRAEQASCQVTLCGKTAPKWVTFSSCTR